jgi:guanylate kinase
VLLVLSGPSGVGKGTIVKRVRERFPDLWESVSYNTRPRRPSEVEGRDYHFVSREEFEALRDADGFLEWFEVFGDLKGTPRAPVQEHLAAGDDVLLELDVQGALRVRNLLPEAVLVLVAPPSLEELHRRLRDRGTESNEALERRLGEAERELARAPEFDHVVVNDDLERVVAEVAGILSGSSSPGVGEP